MGRHSGHIALLSGIAGGAEGIFIPERGNEFDDIVQLYESKARKKEFSIFVVAEGDEEGRAYEISKRFQAIYPETDCRVTVLGHVQRGGRPTANDRILASRLGAHAVKALIDGRRNEAVGVVNNDIKFTSFQEAIEHKKDIQDNLWTLNTIITR
jgi:6-phosphofructokinase 1